jgi:hypothetical protein
MSAKELSVKYIAAMEKTLQTAQRASGPITASPQCLDEVYGYVTAYLADAKFFHERQQYETSLTSIAYCEGVLDALKLIGAVKIQPPK